MTGADPEGARREVVAGCEATGRGALGAVFETIAQFADYAFNKSHSYGYGFVAYQTAYLKANYPVEYFAALLTSVKTNLDKAAIYLNECRQLGIPVLVPDVNRSMSDFVAAVDDDGAGSAAEAARWRDGIIDLDRRRRRRSRGHPRSGCPRCANVGGRCRALVAEPRPTGPTRTSSTLRPVEPGCSTSAHRVDHQGRRLRFARSPARDCGRSTADHRTAPCPPAQEARQLRNVLDPVDTSVERSENPACHPEIGSQAQRLAFEGDAGLYVSEHPLMGAERRCAAATRARSPSSRGEDGSCGASAAGHELACNGPRRAT